MTEQRKRRASGAGEPVRLVDEVIAGPAGALTRTGKTLSGTLTVTTESLPGGRSAAVTVLRHGDDQPHALAGSPFPVPPEGIEALHAVVVAAIGAEIRHRAAQQSAY